MLTKADILRRRDTGPANDSRARPGVYFLLLGKKIVYIGQSKNLGRSIESRRGEIHFAGWSVVTCSDPVKRQQLWRAYVIEIRPPGNIRPGAERWGNKKLIVAENRRGKRVHTPAGEFASLSAAAREHGLTKEGARYKAQRRLDGWRLL